MKKEIYRKFLEFKVKYPKTIVWRAKKHAKVIADHINPGEEVLYVFGGQKNKNSLDLINSCIVAITNKRLIVGTKRLLWGYFYNSITPDLYNDLKLRRNLIWTDIEIDTVKELVYISNVDPKGAMEVETILSEFMMKEKQKYAQNNNSK